MFFDNDVRPADDCKKRKRHELDDSFDAMASYSRSTAPSMFLNPPPAPTRRPSQRLLRPQNDLDDFLSSDLEASFASTMSLNSPPGPLPPANARITPRTTLLLNEYQCSPTAMDISPAPSRTIFDDFKGKIQTKPRSRTSGRELGNFGATSANDSLMGSKSGSGKRHQRSAMPSEYWMDSFSQVEFVNNNVLAMSLIFSMQPHRFPELASAPISICRCFRCHGGR